MNDVDKLVVWNDGPSCEFRNQYVTGMLLFKLSQVVGRMAWWKCFTALHGKCVCVCVCDGVGG